jgi:hypothetical protein
MAKPNGKGLFSTKTDKPKRKNKKSQYNKAPGKKEGKLKQEMLDGEDTLQTMKKGYVKKAGAVKKNGKLKAKVKAIFNKPKKKAPIGDAPRPGGKQYSQKPKARKTGPVKKTKARIAQDYARNAEVDGNSSEGRYEAKMAIKEAASKKGAIYKKGSVLSKHFKSN